MKVKGRDFVWRYFHFVCLEYVTYHTCVRVECVTYHTFVCVEYVTYKVTYLVI